MQRRLYRAAPHLAVSTGTASQQQMGRQTRVLTMLLAIMLGAGLLPLLETPANRTVQAAPSRPNLLTCNGPCVGITHPLYNNNTTAEGPVGTHLTVEGAGWPANSTLTIWPALDASGCAQDPTSDAGTIPVDGAGIARGSYDWPASANQVNQRYTLCAKDGETRATAQANAPNTFTVLAADPPSLTVSPPALIPGGTVTVVGQNWLPAQTVTISICANLLEPATCAPPIIASRQIGPADDGSFQTELALPSDTSPNAYYVIATAGGGALTAPPAGSNIQITVSTPTPTPTLTPIPTPIPRPTPAQPAPVKGSTIILIVVLGGFSLLFLIGGIISLAVYLRGSP